MSTKKHLMAVCLAVMGLTLMSAAVASAMDTPMTATPSAPATTVGGVSKLSQTISCASKGMKMTPSDAKTTAIVRLVPMKNGKQLFGEGTARRLTIKDAAGHRHATPNWAHSDCWTPYPLKPGKPAPSLCFKVDAPYFAVQLDPTDKSKGACPPPTVDPNDPLKIWQYTFVMGVTTVAATVTTPPVPAVDTTQPAMAPAPAGV